MHSQRVLRLFVAAWLALSGPWGAAWAQTAADPGTAELLFFNRSVFTFRAPLTGISATDRAHRAQARLRYLVERGGSLAVTLKPDPAGTLVQINDATAFVVSPADIDPALEETPTAAAQRARDALRMALAEYQQAHNWDYLLRAAAWALGASALVALGLWLARRAHTWMEERLVASSRAHAPRLAIAGVALLRRERAVWVARTVARTGYRLLVLIVALEWLGFVLQQFPYVRSWGESVNAWVWDLARRTMTFAADVVPEMMVAVLILYATWMGTRTLERYFAAVQDGRVTLAWLDPELAAPTRRMASVLVWVFGLAMAYPYLPGSQTEAFKGMTVLLGLMVSLGASGLVGQAVSGMILTYGRIYRKGEYVRLGDVEGTVTELGAFTTRLRTGLGEEVTISNAAILAGTTRNYSRAVKGAGYVLDTTVTIGYDTPWRQVHAMLVEAALKTPGVLAEPAPQVFQTALQDWYPQYRLVCQAVPEEPRPRALVLSALHANIQDVFNTYGVQIMSPQYFEDPPQPKVVPPSAWHTAPAAPPDHKVEKP
ncbi:MAG: mechanosensitive ion channel family protein [Rhodoferax sp.]